MKFVTFPGFTPSTSEQVTHWLSLSKKPEATVAKPAKGVKKYQAQILYKSAKDKSRKAIIALFMAQLGMTAAGASSYYYMVQK